MNKNRKMMFGNNKSYLGLLGLIIYYGYVVTDLKDEKNYDNNKRSYEKEENKTINKNFLDGGQDDHESIVELRNNRKIVITRLKCLILL